MPDGDLRRSTECAPGRNGHGTISNCVKGSVPSFDKFRGKDNTEQRAVARRLEPAADDRLLDQRLHWDGARRLIIETSPSRPPIPAAEFELKPGEGFAGSSSRFASCCSALKPALCAGNFWPS